MTSYTYKFEKIVWMDAASQSGWHTDEHLPRCYQVQSHGFVSYEDEEQVVLSGSRYWENGVVTWGESIAIPKGMIVLRKQLEVESLG